jgi:hypothetical protein
MSLVTLPTEIISRVCRFLALLVVEDYDFPQYDNTSFKALRLTCRELCDKTTYDAAFRYGLQLENLEICLTYKELCWLLQISKTPTLCDNINTVYLYTKDYENNSAICPHTEGAFDMYFASSDCIHILAECFKNLSRGKRLTQIEAGTTKIHSAIFQALNLAQFDRRIMDIILEPQYILDARYGGAPKGPPSYALHVTGITLVPPRTFSMGRQMLRLESDDGHRKGYHTREHRLNQPEVLGFLSQLDKIEALELEGCSDWPHLRLCYGCNDIFARIVSIKYANLTKLRIVRAYISESRLRRFIKMIASTLTKIECIGTILTDGSWRSIAQGLLKVAGLEELMF